LAELVLAELSGNPKYAILSLIPLLRQR
jgi:hypothetical protein